MLIRAGNGKIYNLNDLIRIEIAENRGECFIRAYPQPSGHQVGPFGSHGIELLGPISKGEATEVMDKIISSSGGIDLVPEPKRTAEVF